MKRWVKILIVVTLVQGLIAFAKLFMQWQWDHTVATYCWQNPYFHTPYLNDWIAWLPPSGWKTGVYVYNFLNASLFILTVAMFLFPPILVLILRKRL